MGLPPSVRQVSHPSKTMPVENLRAQTPVESHRMAAKEQTSYDNSLSKSRSIGGSTLQT